MNTDTGWIILVVLLIGWLFQISTFKDERRPQRSRYDVWRQLVPPEQELKPPTPEKSLVRIWLEWMVRSLLMNPVTLEIKEKGDELSMGQTVNVTCIQCEADWVLQGKPEEWKPKKSMSITKSPSGILYCCHRATCPAHSGGMLRSGKFLPEIEPMPKEKPQSSYLNPFYGSLSTIPRNIWEKYLAKYDMPRAVAYQQGWKYCPEKHALVLPLHSARSFQWGIATKMLDYDTHSKGPKSILYRSTQGFNLAFPRAPRNQNWAADATRPIFVVEDVISATKFAWCGVQAVAILGSRFNKDHATELLMNGYKKVVLMLDGDTGAKPVDIRNKWASFFTQFRVILLKKDIDPKDWTVEQIQQADNIYSQ